MNSQTLTIKMHEILSQTKDKITMREIAYRALIELFPGPDDFPELLKFAAGMAALANKAMVSYIIDHTEIPDYGRPRQKEFSFGLPIASLIVIGRGEDAQYIPKEKATFGQVEDFYERILQKATVQRFRAKRLLKDLRVIPDMPRDMPWIEADGLIASKLREIGHAKKGTQKPVAESSD